MIPVVLTVLAAFCLIASLIPLLPFAHGMVRSFDFGRLQVIALAALVVAATMVFTPTAPADLITIGMATAAIMIQLLHVLRFTPLWPRQTAGFKGDPDTAATISVLACNVKESNHDYHLVQDMLREARPDVAVFMETDAAWGEALQRCFKDYPHTVLQPQENSYGMILASRYPLSDTEVRFLLNKEVPSISCVATLPGGHDVRIIALHPEPPLPLRDTYGRDAEILLVAEEAQEEKMPLIVTGVSEVSCVCLVHAAIAAGIPLHFSLSDPRQGAWLLFQRCDSFDARYTCVPYRRWPLDHIFHSQPSSNWWRSNSSASSAPNPFPMYYNLALTGGGDNEPPAKRRRRRHRGKPCMIGHRTRKKPRTRAPAVPGLGIVS